MRDIKRIKPILKRLRIIWEKNPDLRLSQLIGNVYPCTPYDYIDSYYIEDETFISSLEEFYSKERIFRRFGKEREIK